MTIPLPKSMIQHRPRFRFSIRALLLVMAVFGIWLGLRVEQAHRQAQAVQELLKEQSSTSVTYSFEYDRKRPEEAKSWVPSWILARTGPDLFHDVVAVHVGGFYSRETPDGPEVARKVRQLLSGVPRLRELVLGIGPEASDDCLQAVGELSPRLERLQCFNATDVGIAHVTHLRRLKSFSNYGSNVTDGSLRALGTLTKLEYLSLQGNGFTDDGLAHLHGLGRLKHLWINGENTHFTDAGLAHLEGLHQLETLFLHDVTVTPAGYARLKQAIPSLQTKRLPALNAADLGPGWIPSLMEGDAPNSSTVDYQE